MNPLVSICIATYAKPRALCRTLDSIFEQDPPFGFEVIVVDDGSPTDDTHVVCSDWPRHVYCERIEREPGYRNPSRARNVAYRMARGEIVIAQSDDVIHASPDCIERLAAELESGRFVISTVYNVDERGRVWADPSGPGYGDRLKVYTSPERPRPLFFLGSLYRRDLYAVGGNDEEFTEPACEDRWFACCLMDGLGLRPHYSSAVVGHHQAHQHTTDYAAVNRSKALLAKKIADAQRTGRWVASGGSWPDPAPTRGGDSLPPSPGGGVPGTTSVRVG